MEGARCALILGVGVATQLTLVGGPKLCFGVPEVLAWRPPMGDFYIVYCSIVGFSN
jgi:hypothetical protein